MAALARLAPPSVPPRAGGALAGGSSLGLHVAALLLLGAALWRPVAVAPSGGPRAFEVAWAVAPAEAGAADESRAAPGPPLPVPEEALAPAPPLADVAKPEPMAPLPEPEPLAMPAPAPTALPEPIAPLPAPAPLAAPPPAPPRAAPRPRPPAPRPTAMRPTAAPSAAAPGAGEASANTHGAPAALPVAAAPPGPPLVAPRFRHPPAPPPYPPDAQRLGVTGTVLLRARVSPEGETLEVRLWRSSGHPSLDAAGLAAVRRWAFEPARAGAQRIESWVEIPVHFRLH